MPELVAILRGLLPVDAVATMHSLCNAGLRVIEVPLNSPDPFESIALMSANAPDGVTIGAGTVLSAQDVRSVASAGGKLIVSPNMDLDVIRAAKDLGLEVLPGIATPTEAFAALNAGADGLKLFPALQIGASGLAAMHAVLPKDTRVLAVGGVGAANFAEWLAAGASGFGIGSHIFRPGDTPEEVGVKATNLVQALAAASEATP